MTECMIRISQMWEEYLDRIHIGAEGKRATKGRGKRPKLRVTRLAAQVSGMGETAVAKDHVLKQMRKMHARAGDWAARVRKRDKKEKETEMKRTRESEQGERDNEGLDM